MADKNNKLGKGLSSLLSGKSFKQEERTPFLDSMNTELKIGIMKIKPNPKQPRKKFDKIELERLASSIKEKGIITPILVRKNTDLNAYEIIAGERRWRAAQLAGIHEVPVIVKKLNDKETMEISLIENIQRENLNPIEEANAYKDLANEFNYNHDQLAKTVGKSRSHITNMMRLLDLPEFVITRLTNSELSIGQARPLIGLQNADEIAKIIISKKLSARQAEKLAGNYKSTKAKQKYNTADPNINDLEEELSSKIGLKTSISFNKKSTSGSITVYYSNLDQLDDIMRRLKAKK